MPVKIESELRESIRAHWLKAVAALELRNFDYAISLLQGILKEEPEFLVGRQLLRRAEVAKQKGGRRALFRISTSAISIMKAQRELKKNPRRAAEMIEKVLEEEPYNRQANLVLKQAALVAGWPEVAVFALETLLEEKARDTKILHELGRLYHELGESGHEVDVYNRITEIDPIDVEADRLGKDAAARASMKTGGWSTAETYRDVIRDGPAAAAFEQANRLVPAAKSLEPHAEKTGTRDRIEDARERAERNPTDLQIRFELGEHLLQAGRFREALPELQRARQHPHVRLKAMNLLGCCYRELGMLDLAAQQLEEAAGEIRPMDEMKKEIVYNLGLVYELTGQGDKSIAAMKQIYQADYGYRDVAARVEKSYERSAPDQ